MRKKQLKERIILLEQEVEARNKKLINDLINNQKNINALQSKVDKNFNELEKSDMEISEDINKVQDKRWEMLKDYLGVKEEEYAELDEPSIFAQMYLRKYESTPVKKTRLVKIKKSKK